MIIREHCRPGSYRNRAGWLPGSDWPADCVVQWGGDGLVLEPEGSRRTAFFEAFPVEPATFIRGEGPSAADAEQAAFARWTRILACPGHRFERRTYRNGAGVCIACGLFASRIFDELAERDPAPGRLERAFGGDAAELAAILDELSD